MTWRLFCLILSLSTFVFAVSPSAFAQTATVRAYDGPDDEQALKFFASKNSGSGFFRTVVDGSVSGSSSESSPLKTYIPIDDLAGAPDQSQYFTLTSSNLPEIDGGNNFSVFLRTEVEIDNSTNDSVEIYAAVDADDGGDYKAFSLVSNGSDIGANTDEVTRTIVMSFSNICDRHDSCDSGSGFQQESDGDKEEAFKIYIFAEDVDASINPGNSVSPGSGVKDGFYYELNLSDKVPSNYLKPYDVRKSDERLILDYENTLGVTEMDDDLLYKTLVYDYFINAGNGTSPGMNGPGDLVNGGNPGGIHSFEDAVKDGEILVKELENGENYNFAAALVNKYQFASPLSVSVEQSPEDIIELLKEEQCFLLTAGFGEQHPTIEFFKGVRDKWLKHHFAGQLFIRAYYAIGPELAQLIYPYGSIRKGIRVFATFFMWLLWFSPFVVLFAFMGRSVYRFALRVEFWP